MTLTITSYYWSATSPISDAAGRAERNLQDCLGPFARGEVEVVEAYRTEVAPPPPPAMVVEAASADAVAFTSSSAVTAFLEVAGPEALAPIVACIGPVSAATARRHGIAVDVEAEAHTLDGLLDALWRYCGKAPLARFAGRELLRRRNEARIIRREEPLGRRREARSRG